VRAVSSGTRTVRTHHHHRHIPFLSLSKEDRRGKKTEVFAKKKISFFFFRSSKNFSLKQQDFITFFFLLSDHTSHAH